MQASAQNIKRVNNTPPLLDDLVAIFDPNISLYDLHPEEREIRSVQQGRAVSFTGVTSLIQINHAANTFLSWEYTQPWTICFWLNIANTGLTPIDIWSKYVTTGNQNGTRIYTLQGSINVVLAGNLVGNKSIQVKFDSINSISFLPAQNTWVHCTLTNTGSGLASGISCTFNGSYAASNKVVSQDTLNGSGTSVITTTSWRTAAGSNNLFSGSLFDLRMYTAVKTSTQIQNIFNGALEPDNLVVRLLLDEQSGSTFYNSYKTSSQIATYGQGVGDAAINSGSNYSHTTQAIYSWQNNYGYTLSGSVYIPRNYAVSSIRGTVGTDCVGNTLQYYRPVRYRITNSGTINFNPDSAPLSKYQSDTWTNTTPKFALLASVPTAYSAGDSSFAWGSIKSVLYVDRKNGSTSSTEKNFLIYRNEKSLADKGTILSFIRKKTILIELFGQSNGSGSNNLASDLAGQGYAQTVANGWIWNNNTTSLPGTAFVGLRAALDGTNTGGGSQVGPDISLITDLVTNEQNEVFLVKYAIGATSLNNDGFPYWLPTPTTDVGYPTSNKLYPNEFAAFKASLTYVRNTINRKNDLIVIAVFDQGENDCNATDSAVYQTNLTTLYTRMCEHMGGTYFIQRLLSTKQTTLSATQRTNVNSAKTAFSALNSINRYTYASESANYTMTADNVHFTAQGQVQSGKDIASIIINSILPTII